MNGIISLSNFYNISDSDKKILIEDIFHCKNLHDSKPNSKGVSSNFLVSKDRLNILPKIYNKILETCKNLFKEIDLADRNSTKCWSLCTNKDYWESVPHDHLETSTINTVYYLQIPKIGNNFCGKIRFLINNEWEDYQPKPNELLIIPNCLVHDTTFHNTEEWRIILNFEIITNNKLYLK